MTTEKHSACIGQLTVRNSNPYIVYGSVRGLISGRRTLGGACRAAQRDRKDCSGLGGGAYSDVAVYSWDDDHGWVTCEIDLDVYC